LTYSFGSLSHPDFAIDTDGTAFLVWEEVTPGSSVIGMGQMVSP